MVGIPGDALVAVDITAKRRGYIVRHEGEEEYSCGVITRSQ